jgi:hypothetical protein
VLAVDDRHDAERMGGSPAAHRFRSIFRQLDGAGATVWPAAEYSDIQKALNTWKITSFGFTIRPFNPHPPSKLAKELGEALKKRGVAKEKGEWLAERDGGIKSDQEMKAIVELSEAGYGQLAIQGNSKGYSAQIKKSQFFDDKDRNVRSMNRPREMRVSVDISDRDSERAMFRRPRAAGRRGGNARGRRIKKGPRMR